MLSDNLGFSLPKTIPTYGAHGESLQEACAVRERPPVLATAASGQAKHHPVYPGASTVRGVIWDRLTGPWKLTEYALL